MQTDKKLLNDRLVCCKVFSLFLFNRAAIMIMKRKHTICNATYKKIIVIKNYKVFHDLKILVING